MKKCIYGCHDEGGVDVCGNKPHTYNDWEKKYREEFAEFGGTYLFEKSIVFFRSIIKDIKI